MKGKTYTVIDGISGKGQFVGVTLATGMNGNNTCWVEGEARMYLDDDNHVISPMRAQMMMTFGMLIFFFNRRNRATSPIISGRICSR